MKDCEGVDKHSDSFFTRPPYGANDSIQSIMERERGACTSATKQRGIHSHWPISTLRSCMLCHLRRGVFFKHTNATDILIVMILNAYADSTSNGNFILIHVHLLIRYIHSYLSHVMPYNVQPNPTQPNASRIYHYIIS